MLNFYNSGKSEHFQIGVQIQDVNKNDLLPCTPLKNKTAKINHLVISAVFIHIFYEDFRAAPHA
jgi:hypothetical protein